ncbi:hypothetical protein CRG98_011359 [Punica granatum]|uniref:Uncharacterized protein n=1 Tax=Punica granatum TaxID=22663 RepID=A0A2I0KJ49_PUNGR|nr:hypothetical protein CRG98_011359 [Punica granatum]
MPVGPTGCPRADAIQADPSLFAPNDHHFHLRGSLKSREPSTLHKNSIGNHRGDVRPETCPVGSVHEHALFCVFFAGLYGLTQVSFYQTTTTATSEGLLGVGSRRPFSKIPPGASGRAVSFRTAQSDQRAYFESVQAKTARNPIQ